MNLDESHPLNRQVLRHCSGRRGQSPPVASPSDHPDPYRELGSHPDVVERVWEQLGAALPAEARVIVYGTPALVHPEAGVVLAMAYGTQYAFRVPDDLIDEARQAGCETVHTWSTGAATDLEQELGRGWLFGNYDDREMQWLLKMYEQTRSET